MKTGFIGYGNIGEMIIKNILSLNILNEEEIIVSNRTITKLDLLKEKYPKITTTSDNKYLTRNSDKIFIFVKTPQFKEVMEEVNPYLSKNFHIIHVCAGLSFEDIATIYDGPVSQVIPSIASTTNEKLIDSNFRKKGVSLIVHNKKVNNHEKEFVEELFNEFSYIEIIEKGNVDNLELATALTSCGPAFIALLVKKLSKIASLKSKFDVGETEDMVVKTLFGTSLLLSNLDEDKIDTNADETIEKVATKKGITQKGLDYLDPEIERIANELFDKII
ncbi:MAG: NAD(P)-binding domain-containing protein [Methanobacteriaceae archaeon]|jgi:pyrroline-5-carboxylate reductase|nr:NAD(P)-binding domain-containing protein [Candidatus Methanorudis spinitermitis]